MMEVKAKSLLVFKTAFKLDIKTDKLKKIYITHLTADWLKIRVP